MNGLTEQLLCSPWFHVSAGACVGIGIMILALAKYGKKIFLPELVPEGSNNPTVRAIWDKINLIEERQVTLRTELPHDYAATEALADIRKGQERIESKLDNFMRDCRAGNCSAGRK